jgi:peroxiredoxin
MHKLLPLLALCLTAATPGVNDKAPDFTLDNLQGKHVRLSEQTAKGTVVLVVLRGYPGYQCPLCNRQVQEFIKSGPAFAEAGAHLLFVYPGPADKGEEFLKDKAFPSNFTMVLDPDYAFTNLYNLRWDAPKETAYPSTFIINKSGVVTFAKISRAHGGRTTAAEILAHLKQ